jgi:hypothetical protein
MEKEKKILSILAIMTIAVTIFAPTLLIKTASATDPDAWYTNVSGVLASDYYSLYPFNKKNLKIGFSKFGEMIDSRSTYNVGLEYDTRDPFAPPAGSSVPSDIPKHKWSQGWLINITYYHIPTGVTRNVWACALHADLTDYGNDWIRVDNDWYGGVSGGPATEAAEDPRDPGLLISDPTSTTHYGGRKTNGTVVTESLTVLYNGPRMYIARTVNHVKDWIQTSNTTGTDEPLVDVVFTIIFNKVKKEVIVLKDIKITTTKFVVGPIAVPGAQEGTSESGLIIQFSNRGEWDLGPSSGANAFQSYVHLYRGDYALSTVYDNDYHLNPTLPASTYSSYGSQPGSSGTYDLAQIISADVAYVGWAAFWPSLSDWSVDAGRQDLWWKSLVANDPHTVDGVGGEPFRSPYLIGEWDFFLTESRSYVSGAGRYFDRQFRGVTVYGITDRWDGDDANRSGGSNVIDTEVQYQLEEVFNPWDLYAAVHKDTRRWVEFHTVTLAEKTAAEAGTNLNITLSNKPVKYVSTWEDYCNFSERVMWGGALKYPARSVYYSGSSLSVYEPYELYVNSTGHGTITIRAASVPAVGSIIKVLYSTNTSYAYNVTENPVSLSYYNSSVAISDSVASFAWSNSTYWVDCLGATHIVSASSTVELTNSTALLGNHTFNLTGSFNWFTYYFKVYKEETAWLGIWDLNLPPANMTVSGNTTEMNVTDAHLNWRIDTPSGDDLHVAFLDAIVSYNFTFVYNTATGNYTVYIAINITSYPSNNGILYREYIPGRYEWIIVGNHSRAIDSVGAAMISEGLKEKQIITDNGGLDMSDVAWGPRIPYLLANMGNATWRAGGPAWTNWYDSLGRLGLLDDWCTRYPISSSNIITVAGPSANLVSEYFNEFSQAIQIYGITGATLMDVIFATTCWNTTALSNYLGQYYYSDGQFYTGNTTTGIGVITTYKDINGTVGLLIHGWSGDDTYYTAKWFQEYGVYYLQTENRGVTTLVVRLNYQNYTARLTNPMPPDYDYDSHFPYVEIVERLGTISEKSQHDP